MRTIRILTRLDEPMERTVVIIHPGSLGDVLLAVPAMRRLQARFPQHRRLLISNEPIGRFLRDCRMVDAWISVQGVACADLFAGSAPTSCELAGWFETCDCVVAWIKDEEETLRTALRGCGIRETWIQSPFDSRLKARHQRDRFLETIDETADEGSPDVRVAIPSDVAEQGLAYLDRLGIPSDRPIVVIHPGSGTRRKCVKPEVLALVMERFQREGTQPCILEGPADRESVAALRTLVPAAPLVVGGRDLSAVAGLLARSVLYIGNDSGMTHLAALLAVPTIALFGPTDPDRWAPRGSHVVVVRGASCICPSWDRVAVCSAQPCFPTSAEAIVDAGKKIARLDDTTPRNPSQYPLSQPDSCATVPRSFSLSMITT